MKDIIRTAVIGGGAMGHGIAQVFAQSGCEVFVYDTDNDVLDQVPENIKSNLELLAEYGAINEKNIENVVDRIQLCNSMKQAVAKANLILEAVPEDPDLKGGVFAEVEKSCSEDAILATTTSVIRVNDIAEHCKRPGNVVGTHWMNPPFVLPLVEIVKGPKTDEDVVQTVKHFLEDKCGKRTVTCKDAPGFLVNRMAGAVLVEAAKMIDENLATFQDIDRAWKEHLGFVFLGFGPFGNMDHIGLDVVYLAANYLSWALEDDRFKPPKWFEDKINEGQLGTKSGKGIYDYTGKSPEDMRKARIEKLLMVLQGRDF